MLSSSRSDACSPSPEHSCGYQSRWAENFSLQGLKQISLTTIQPQKQRWCWAPLIWSCCLRGSFPRVSFLSFVFVGHFQQQYLKGTLLSEDRGSLEDCTREVCIWGVFKTHYPNLRVTTFQDIIVSWTPINSFTNHDPLCIKTPLQRLFQHYFLLQIQTAGKNKWIYQHLCLAVTSYSHMDFMLRRLRYGNIKWQQETCKPCRKNNSEHLNHEVSMMLEE